MTKRIFIDAESSLPYPAIAKLGNFYDGVENECDTHYKLNGREYTLISSEYKSLSANERVLGIFLSFVMAVSVVGLFALIHKNTLEFIDIAYSGRKRKIETYLNDKILETDLCTQMFLAIKLDSLTRIPAKFQEDPDSMFKIDDHFASPFITAVLAAKKTGDWKFVEELLKLGQLKDFDDNKWLNWFVLVMLDRGDQNQNLLDTLIDIKNPALLSPRILTALAMSRNWDVLDRLIDQVDPSYIEQDVNYDNFFDADYYQKSWVAKMIAKQAVKGRTWFSEHFLGHPEVCSPLKLAIAHKKWPLVEKMLVKCPNAKLDVYDLFAAASDKKWELLFAIFASGTALDVSPQDQYTLLRKACEDQQWDSVEAILCRFPDLIVETADDLDSLLLEQTSGRQVSPQIIMHLMLKGAAKPGYYRSQGAYEECSARLQNLFERIALMYCDQKGDLSGNTLAILPYDVQHMIVRNMIDLYCPEMQAIPIALVLEKLTAYFKLQGIATLSNNEKLALALQRPATL